MKYRIKKEDCKSSRWRGVLYYEFDCPFCGQEILFDDFSKGEHCGGCGVYVYAKEEEIVVAGGEG